MGDESTMNVSHALTAARLSRSFIFSTGIENSAPTIAGPDGRTTRIDQMETCGFYRRWREDFQLVRSLGLRCLRFGTSGNAPTVTPPGTGRCLWRDAWKWHIHFNE